MIAPFSFAHKGGKGGGYMYSFSYIVFIVLIDFVSILPESLCLKVFCLKASAATYTYRLACFLMFIHYNFFKNG